MLNTFVVFQGLIPDGSSGQQDWSIYASFLNDGWVTNDGWTTRDGWTSLIRVNGQTFTSPAAAVFHGQYFVASILRVNAVEDINNSPTTITDYALQITSSTDGVTWTAPAFLNQFPYAPGTTNQAGPALAVFQDRLYMAFLGATDGSIKVPRVLLCSSADGTTFTPTPTRVNSAQSNATPALAAYQDQLWAAWLGTDGKIYLSSSADGTTWAAPVGPVNVNGKSAWGTAPALTVYNNRLYVALTDQSGNVYVCSTGDGQSWSVPSLAGQCSVNNLQSSALGASCGMLIVMGQAPDHSGGLWYSTSVDGTHWVQRGLTGQMAWVPPMIASGQPAQLPAVFRAPAANQMFSVFQADNSTRTLLASFYDSGNSPFTNNGWTTNINTHTASACQPGSVVFRSQYFIGFVARNSGGSIQITSSADGMTWSASVSTNQTSGHGPVLAVFQNQLYMAFIANDSSGHVLVTSSGDGTTWPSSNSVIPGANSPQPPALAVCQNQLFVAWMGTDKKIYLSSSPDGVTWAPPYSFTIPNGCSCPGLTALNNNLYVTFLESSTQAVYVATLTGAPGQLSSSTVSLGQTALSGNQPAIGTYGSMLFLMYPDSNRNLVYCTSTDGTTWVNQGAFGQASPCSPCLAAGPAGPLPLSLLGRNQAFTAFQANNSTHSLLACFYDPRRASWTTNGWTKNVNTHTASTSKPAAVVFRSQYFIGFVAMNSGGSIQITSSADGVTWSAGVSTNQASGHGPALAMFQNQLYMSFVASDSTNRVMLVSARARLQRCAHDRMQQRRDPSWMEAHKRDERGRRSDELEGDVGVWVRSSRGHKDILYSAAVAVQGALQGVGGGDEATSLT